MKIIQVLLDQKYTFLGMLAAWVCLEGSARTIVTYGIAFVTLVDIVEALLRKEEE